MEEPAAATADVRENAAPERESYFRQTARRLRERLPKAMLARCTVYLDPEVNERLEHVARHEAKSRSTVVNEILRDYLPEYKIQRVR